MKLITETVEDVQYIIESAENGKKNVFIEGICLQGNVVNRNKRIYPVDVLSNEVNRYVTENISKNRAYGELGHPASPTINLHLVPHMIKELRQDGDNFIGKAKLMDTPMGLIAQNFIHEGATLGVSSRGLGTVKANSKGLMEIQNDFRLATAFDIVADPSAPDAYVKGIMENVDWLYDENLGWKAMEVVEEQKKIISNVRESKMSLSTKMKLFEQFLNSISK